jgi:hypothetical protein
MATVMGNLGNGFYSAFYEPDLAKRREALQSWVKLATPEIQTVVESELNTFVELVTDGRWTEDGWKQGEGKLRRIQNDYPLVLEIMLHKLDPNKKYAGKLPDRVEYKPLDPINSTEKQNQANSNMAQNTIDDDGDDDLTDDERSPNDDRSDSMNPNNDDYQASMDNRSDQMNPNNDAYWSSRGR